MKRHLLSILPLLALFSACRFSPSSPVVLADLELPAVTPSDDTIRYSGFTSSYNHTTLIPDWVAYELTAKELQPVYTSQSSSFSMDLNLRGPQAMREDYSRSGWDRGHLAPKADMRWSERSYWESHYFTNVCPQNHDLNAGDWNTLEKSVRQWARQYGRIYVVCGPVITSGSYGTIGRNRVQVPDAFFKALLVPSRSGYSAVAFLLPNSATHHRLAHYAMTIDSLETIIGRNLFVALDDAGYESVESEIDLSVWNL